MNTIADIIAGVCIAAGLIAGIAVLIYENAGDRKGKNIPENNKDNEQ